MRCVERLSLISRAFSLSFFPPQTPPEAVRDATVFAEYAQGLSVEWAPVMCTLRWDTYGIYYWELVSPFLACFLPVLYIWASGPLRRFISDKIAQIKYWARFTPEERAAALAFRKHERAEAKKAKRAHVIAMAIKYGIPPPVFDAAGNVVVAVPEQEEAAEGSEAAAAAAVEGGAITDTEDGEEEEAEAEEGQVANEMAGGNQTTPRRVVRNVVTWLEDEVERQPQPEVLAGALTRTGHGARRFDVRYGFFESISEHALYVLEEPQGRNQIPLFGIRPGEVVRAEEVHDANIRIIGVWGSGWLPLHGVDARPQLVELAASEVLLTADFAARDLPPTTYSREAVPGLDNVDHVDDAGHRFRTIEALCPQRGIEACVSNATCSRCELCRAHACSSLPSLTLLLFIFFSSQRCHRIHNATGVVFFSG